MTEPVLYQVSMTKFWWARKLEEQWAMMMKVSECDDDCNFQGMRMQRWGNLFFFLWYYNPSPEEQSLVFKEDSFLPFLITSEWKLLSRSSNTTSSRNSSGICSNWSCRTTCPICCRWRRCRSSGECHKNECLETCAAMTTYGLLDLGDVGGGDLPLVNPIPAA